MLTHVKAVILSLALLTVGAASAPTVANASHSNQTLSWGQNAIAASGCRTFYTPWSGGMGLHVRMSQYVCWRNGRITDYRQPREECSVNAANRALQVSCTSRAYTQTYHSGISLYSRGTFSFRQSVAGWQTWAGWDPAVSIRVRARDQIATAWVWNW